MTTEQARAIKYLTEWKNAIIDRGDTLNSQAVQALIMAIEALEQEPSCRNTRQVDLISRQAAIEAICVDGTMLERQGQYSMTMVERKQRDTDILEALPSVVPSRATGKWIPVSEPPKENGDYIVSLEDSVYPGGRFFNGKWFMAPVDGIAREFGEYEVVAWMPLPEPYKESEQ